jgi:hypothetical protein
VAALPLAAGAWRTAAVAMVVNALLLWARIHAEEKAMGAGWEAVFVGVGRFLPGPNPNPYLNPAPVPEPRVPSPLARGPSSDAVGTGARGPGTGDWGRGSGGTGSGSGAGHCQGKSSDRS